MSSDNNGEDGYNGGACLLCGETQFDDGHDGFFYCMNCLAQTRPDGMYTGTLDEETGVYKEEHYGKPYTPTVPPPGLACPKCASTKIVDGPDDFYTCTDCPTKMFKEDPSATISMRMKRTLCYYDMPAPDPLSESEWDCVMCNGIKPYCPHCIDWLADAVEDTTL